MNYKKRKKALQEFLYHIITAMFLKPKEEGRGFLLSTLYFIFKNVPSPKIVIKLTWTYENFSVKEIRSVQQL